MPLRFRRSAMSVRAVADTHLKNVVPQEAKEFPFESVNMIQPFASSSADQSESMKDRYTSWVTIQRAEEQDLLSSDCSAQISHVLISNALNQIADLSCKLRIDNLICELICQFLNF